MKSYKFPIITSRKEAVERIDLLIDYLKFHSKLYYNYPMSGGFEMITDAEWDSKYIELEELERYHTDIPIRKDSPTQNADSGYCFNYKINNFHCKDKHFPNRLDKKNNTELIKFKSFYRRFDLGIKNSDIELSKECIYYLKRYIYAMYRTEICSPIYVIFNNGGFLIKFRNELRVPTTLFIKLISITPSYKNMNRLFYIERLYGKNTIMDVLLFVRF